MGQGKQRTAGVVAVKPRDEGEEPCILFVVLRWTRSGFKAMMHVLNGSDKYKPHGARTLMANCTDDELAFLLGTRQENDDEDRNHRDDHDDDAAAARRHVARLWNSPLVPSSWTKDQGNVGVEAAHHVYPQLASAAREERRRRAGGGACRRDALSKASLQLPKGVVDPGETPWNAALRELREEAGVAGGDEEVITRSESAPGIRAGPMTAFVVTLGEQRTAAKEVWGAEGLDGIAGLAAGGWKVEGSPETVAAVWVPVSRVTPGPGCAVHHVRQVKEVLEKVLPNLDEWVPPRARGQRKREEVGEGKREEEGEEREGVKRARHDF